MTTVSGDGPRTPSDGAGPSGPPPDAFYDTAPVAELPLSPASDVLPPAPPVGGRAARRTPPRPPGAGTPSPAGRVILPLALAAVCVVALLAGWNQLQSEQAASAAAPPASGATPTPGPAVTSAAPSPSVSTPSSPAATATATSATPSASPSRPASPSASASFVVDRSVPVTVLNGTTRTGLAAAVAAELEAKGWRVVSTGNWRSGGIESTTVFVDGEKNAAATMRKDLTAADATRAPIGAMKDGRITIVVMDDYPR